MAWRLVINSQYSYWRMNEQWFSTCWESLDLGLYLSKDSLKFSKWYSFKYWWVIRCGYVVKLSQQLTLYIILLLNVTLYNIIWVTFVYSIMEYGLASLVKPRHWVCLYWWIDVCSYVGNITMVRKSVTSWSNVDLDIVEKFIHVFFIFSIFLVM